MCACAKKRGRCDSKKKKKKLYLHHSVEPANTHVHVHVSELVVAAQKVDPSWVHDLESKQQSYNLHLVSTPVNKISVEYVLDVPGCIVCVCVRTKVIVKIRKVKHLNQVGAYNGRRARQTTRVVLICSICYMRTVLTTEASDPGARRCREEAQCQQSRRC